MAQRRGPDGTARTAVSGTINGESWANVFWTNLGGGINAQQSDLDGWNTKFHDVYVAQIIPHLHPTIVLGSVTTTLFQPNEGALHSVHPSTDAGTATGTYVEDLSASRCLSWQSTVYWRGGKPRTYLPGLLDSDTTDGKTLTPAAKTLYATMALNFHSAINALSNGNIVQTQHGFVSFFSGGVLRNPSVFFAITGGTAHARIASQRGRLGPWLP